MKDSLLFGYQLLTGASDTITGALLILSPAFTSRILSLQVPVDALPYLAFVGAFVLSVGLGCFYGAWIVYKGDSLNRLGPVWLLTALTRSAVAIFLFTGILAGTLEATWLTVAIFDCGLVIFQAVGMRGGWLTDVAR